VSLVATVLAQAGLALAYGVLYWPVSVAVMLSLAVSAVPAYVLNARYVWPSARRVRHESVRLAAFIAAALAGSVLTIGFVWSSTHVAALTGASHTTLSLVANGSALAATATIWLGRYVFFERVLFRD
jgi:putative flippase GtrA